MVEYEAVMGLEVHVELATATKLFCGCPNEFGSEPNTNICPVCLGLPGSLPVLNERVVEFALRIGEAFHFDVPERSIFHRKNYFYPDMPKNYQITQFAEPICLDGGVALHEFAYPKDAQKSIAAPGKVVGLTRIHLEEDVAKSQHFDSNSGIDFNRAGTPLMEIVSEPEIDTPEEAFAYLTALQQILIYGGVSDADMEKGQLRCDCNISVRPEGQAEFGTKIEIKNMNSISAVRRAIAYEIERQTEAYGRGETLIQSTRGWNDDTGQTYHMRTKESSHDYRYFPDPDLLPLMLDQAYVDELRAGLPELPDAKQARFVAEYSLSPYDAAVLVAEQANAEYFETVAEGHDPKQAANWVTGELFALLNRTGATIETSPVSAKNLGRLLDLIADKIINGKIAKDVFDAMVQTGEDPVAIVEVKGLRQVTDTGAIDAAVDGVIAANMDKVGEYRSGKEKLFGFFVGQVMKAMAGKGNPALVNDILKQKLSGTV